MKRDENGHYQFLAQVGLSVILPGETRLVPIYSDGRIIGYGVDQNAAIAIKKAMSVYDYVSGAVEDLVSELRHS